MTDEAEHNKEEEQSVSEEAGSTEATCSLSLRSEKYKNVSAGMEVRLACPAGCDKVKVPLYGPAPEDASSHTPEVYDEDSSVCRAAIHAGIITAEEGGDVVFFAQPGRDEYPSSVRNKIESLSKPASTQSFGVKKPKPLIVLRCSDTI